MLAFELFAPVFVICSLVGLCWYLNARRQRESLEQYRQWQVFEAIVAPTEEERREEYSALLTKAGWVFFEETPGFRLSRPNLPGMGKGIRIPGGDLYWTLDIEAEVPPGVVHGPV